MGNVPLRLDFIIDLLIEAFSFRKLKSGSRFVGKLQDSLGWFHTFGVILDRVVGEAVSHFVEASSGVFSLYIVTAFSSLVEQRLCLIVVTSTRIVFRVLHGVHNLVNWFCILYFLLKFIKSIQPVSLAHWSGVLTTVIQEILKVIRMLSLVNCHFISQLLNMLGLGRWNVSCSVLLLVWETIVIASWLVKISIHSLNLWYLPISFNLLWLLIIVHVLLSISRLNNPQCYIVNFILEHVLGLIQVILILVWVVLFPVMWFFSVTCVW